jgi:uncharacterized BrkB/YihY/UPF0761 family membrane protein
MRFIVFLLALAAALTAVLALLIATMSIFTDNPHDPKVVWGYALVVAAAAAMALSLISALAVWVSPRSAGWLLSSAAMAGVAGMAAESVIMFLVRNNPNAPDAYNIATGILLSGAAPALLAAMAAWLTSRVAAAG